jgi:NADPH:quinone reductase-like Zn-dependent oxidoreductase
MSVRAVQIDRHGGPEVLRVRAVPVPTVRAGEVLVRTVASSLNPVDWKTRTWDRGPAFPMTLGSDLAGIVVESTVAPFRTGDRVVAFSDQQASGIGTWADLVALPAELLAPAPTRAALTEAATLPLAGLTALQALTAMEVQSTSRVLVAGAAGAVGALFVQLAVQAGATVDGLVSRPGHVEPIRKLGAALVTHDPARLSRGTYAAVFDTAGLQRAGVQAGPLLGAGGRYVSITDDPLPDIPGAGGVQVREDGAGLARLVRWVDDGALMLRVAAHYPLQQVREAHRRFEAGGLLGKVVLVF